MIKLKNIPLTCHNSLGILDCHSITFDCGNFSHPRSFINHPKLQTFQPLGISPNSESSKESGNKSLISFDSPVGLPSTFALTGSKSINQDLKSVF